MQDLPVAELRVATAAEKGRLVQSKVGMDVINLGTDDSQNQDSASLEETELLAPSSAVEEERRLQHEREEQEKEESKKAPQQLIPSTLDNDRFASLNFLLKQSEVYTQFLAEQMKEIEEQITAEARASAAKRMKAAAKQQKEQEQHEEVKGKGKKRGRGSSLKTGTSAASSTTALTDLDADDQGPGAKKTKLTLTPTQELLPLMTVELRDYQLKGVKWLISLYQNGVNGILADQMGLGKTVQTIGFLSHLKTKGIHGPFMVVGPLSCLTNWVNEFNRFCPSLPPLLYHGTKQEREQLRKDKLKINGKVGPDFPVLVTSYEILIADSKALSKIKFRYLVVDEGHRLKNFNCKLIRELRTIPADNKLLLSGTPLQNNLSELWSLLNFLMPEVFKDLGDFEAWFAFSSAVGHEGADKEILAAEQRNQVLSKLHAILKPFMLRRLKSDVQIQLPPKQEIVLYAEMSKEQANINLKLKEGTIMQEMTAFAEAEGGSRGSMGKLNNVLMQLRKNCNHPDLITSAFTNEQFYPPPDVLERQSGKMKLMGRLLKKLHAKGHKVLIFSQMVTMLDIIESYASQLGHEPVRLDGSLGFQERQDNINSFNNDENTWLFLLSTRAGGLGINLTAADTVIIYDSDWNPHADMQAMDRCHRIGQTKPVLVFRLATAHSVEGKMLKRAADKMALERLVIKKGHFKDITMDDAAAAEEEQKQSHAKSLSAAELMELLRGDYRMDDLPQSGVVSDKAMEMLLDRRHLSEGKPLPYAESGVGYEVVASSRAAAVGASLLSNINK